MKKIVICGNYGATNIGDEAILAGILKLFGDIYPEDDSSRPDITVLSANPTNTTALHGVNSLPLLPAGPRSFFRGLFKGTIFKTLDAIRTCDGFILGGGGLFNDEKPLSIIIWGLQAKFALLFGKPIFCIGQSVGPLNNFFSRFIVKFIFSRCRSISVRDRSSQQVLHALGLPLAQVCSDPAFSLSIGEPAGTEREGFVVVSLRGWHKNIPSDMPAIIAGFIDTIYRDHGLKTVLVPFSSYPENDTALLDKIFEQVKSEGAAEIFEFSNDWHKVLVLIGKAKAVVGMRLHSLIFATLTLTPFVAIPYSQKVTSFTESLGMERHCLPLADLSEKSLTEKFEGLMAGYDKTRDTLIEQNLLNRESARQNGEMLRLFIDSL